MSNNLALIVATFVSVILLILFLIYLVFNNIEFYKLGTFWKYLYLFFVFGTFRFIKGLGKSKSDPMKDTDNQKQNLKSEILPLENPINLTDFEDITDNKNINILKTVENKEIKSPMTKFLLILTLFLGAVVLVLSVVAIFNMIG